jgi:N6-adenosine-specific RNA methylase IME4
MDSLSLIPYDVACRAVAEARRIDELKDMLDIAAITKEYARRAKNHQMEADAVEIRLRATRRLNELIQAQRQTVGLAQGTRGSKIKGARVDDKPTLAEAGIDKNLAHQARVLGKLSDEKFEQAIADARDTASRAFKTAVNAAAIEQEREAYRARTYQGGTIADLEALAQSGKRFGVISPDFPWDFETWSDKGKQRSAERHYDTWSLERIKAFAPIVGRLAAPDCALVMWIIWPLLLSAREVIEACGGFEYKTCEFVWIKTTKNAEVITLDGSGLHTGKGRHTRSNSEVCLVATRGSPRRIDADVHQVIVAPVGEHSEKPAKVYRCIEALYPGPFLELFARKGRPNWTTWGNEVPPPPAPADPEATHEAAE